LIPVAALFLFGGCATTTPLMTAAEHGDIRAVKEILATGANIDDVDMADRTALHIAAIHGRTEVVRFLLDHGANVDAKAGPSQGFQRTLTPLHYATKANKDNVDVVRLLLDRKADIDAVSDEGRTALHYASSRRKLPRQADN